jgi:hypothetical protein
MNTNWNPVTLPANAPASDALEYTLTPAESSRAAVASIALERNRRQQNARDKAAAEAAARGNDARLGVTWDEPA